MTRHRVLILLALVFASIDAAQAQPGSSDVLSALGDGSIVLFRHAEAPGVGDPPQFRLDDCSTQRNLDDEGRAQARRIGEKFRAQGVKVGKVLHSQWCRTRETAELAFPGQAREATDFNSFFGEAARREAQTERALAILRAWRGPGVLVVVTHQVNISAMTGAGTASAEGLVVRTRNDRPGAEVLARWRP
jgi:phosphohistidine phosphatase SixA